MCAALGTASGAGRELSPRGQGGLPPSIATAPHQEGLVFLTIHRAWSHCLWSLQQPHPTRDLAPSSEAQLAPGEPVGRSGSCQALPSLNIVSLHRPPGLRKPVGWATRFPRDTKDHYRTLLPAIPRWRHLYQIGLDFSPYPLDTVLPPIASHAPAEPFFNFSPYCVPEAGRVARS